MRSTRRLSTGVLVAPGFEKELRKLEKEVRGEYVARNMCDDAFWKCSAASKENGLDAVSYEVRKEMV